MSTFADRLSGAMKAAELENAAELARRAGCTRQAIHKWLNGDPIKDAAALFGLATALNVSARWLLLDEGLPSQKESLSEDERTLLSHYREMTEQKRLLLLQIVEGMRE